MGLGWDGSVVPFGEEFVEQDWQGGFEVGGDLAAGFVGAADDVDGGFESGWQVVFEEVLMGGVLPPQSHSNRIDVAAG